MPVHLKQIAPIEMSITFLYKEVWQSGLMYVYSALKELEHRKLGWKILILKYDLG